VRSLDFPACKCRSFQPTLFRIRNVMMHFEGWDLTVEGGNARFPIRKPHGERMAVASHIVPDD